MSYSLLAHLYPYIKGSQEDIATFSLQYLLSQSVQLNRAFTKRMADNMQIELEETLQYICQVTGKGEEKERPDMAGIGFDGKEVILCEMKFYASLTANQPITYLHRLKNNGGKGLMFVCPAARRTSLWSKLKELCGGMEIEEVNDYCISVDGIRLAIITWIEIIEMLEQVASSVDVKYTADISQLKGYCNQMDSDAFIPFTAEDLSAEMAKRGERYYQIIDEVMDLLEAEKSIKTSKEGLKANAYRKGYTRSLYIDELAITLNYDRDFWNNPSTVETPFWITIKDDIRGKKWFHTPELREKLMQFPEQKREHSWAEFLALEPLQNAPFAEVCEDMKQQILEYIKKIR